jgi:hypothetical protein
MCQDLSADLHVFGSYVTGHLPRAHPLVADTTHDDRSLECIWLGNELNTLNFLMWRFKLKKVYTMSDPRHFDTILPFLQPGDVGHKLISPPMTLKRCIRHPPLGISDPTTTTQARSRGSSSLSPVSSTLIPSSDSGENISLPDQGEQGIIQTSESSDRTDRIADMVDNLLYENDLTLKQHKTFKQAEDTPPEVVIQYLMLTLLAKILVYHKHVLTLSCSFLQVDSEYF